MKAHLRRLLRRQEDLTADRVNTVREYLQARILENLQRQGAMVPLAFHGGTALRFLFDLPRFSEDLDFALERPERGYDFERLVGSTLRTLGAEGYEVEASPRTDRTVHSSFVRFQGLPHELGLSPHPDHKLSIKIEVDTCPPAGAVLETTVVRDHVPLQLQHHDRASLLAGKLHAVLQRPYAKGRDLYDLYWYLSDPSWPAPNLELLNNALGQTGWDRGHLAPDSWREAIAERVATLDFERTIADVEPFIEPWVDLGGVTQEVLLDLVRRRAQG